MLGVVDWRIEDEKKEEISGQVEALRRQPALE